MKKNKPIILLYPPPSDPTQPYSSLPALAGYLRNKQYTVIQRDLGIELLTRMISRKMLRKALHSANARAEGPNSSIGDKEYLERFYSIIGISEYIIENIDEAIDLMHDKNKFYELDNYQWAVRLLELACDLASLPYHPTIYSPSDYETNYEPTFKGLLEITSSRADNMFFDIFNRELVPQIIQMEPLLVGLSITYLSQIVPAFTLSRLLKSLAPGIHISIGGAMIHQLEEQLLDDPTCFEFADSFCIGEGETALSTLAMKISSGEELKSVPNMIINFGGCANAGNLRFCEDIDSLPCPDYDGLELERYLSPEPVLLLSSTRGCYHGKCAFCNVSMNTRRIYRQIGKEYFISNVKNLYRKYDAKRFFFCDDAMPPAHMLNVSELVRDTLKDVTWCAEARFERVLSSEFVSTLRDGGCRYLIFGLESASQRVLNAMNKGNSIETDTAILEAFSANGIYVNLQTLIGFPTETIEEARATMDYLKNNERCIFSFGCSLFMLEKNTPVYCMPWQYGVNTISIPNTKTLIDHYDYVPLTGMTMEEAEREHNLALERLRPLFAGRAKFLTRNCGIHALLQLSHYGYDEIYHIWKEMDKMQPVNELDIDNLVLAVSPALIFSYHPSGQIMFCTKTGMLFLLSSSEHRLLEICNNRRTVGEILSLWISEQTQNLDEQILLLARGYAMIRDFLKKGLAHHNIDFES